MENKNEWKKIWDKKKFISGGGGYENLEDLFMQMKIADGYDALGELKITYVDFKEQFDDMYCHLTDNGNGKTIRAKSAYEVGCGCGPNLLLMQERGITVGGMDYSEGLIQSAKEYIRSDDLRVGEARSLATEPRYDLVFSKGCFCYFESEDYAEQVMKLMLEKANFSIGILDLFDLEKEEEFLAYRRKHIENYDEKYKGLGKLFISRDFFVRFAKRGNLDITFTQTNLAGYWNNEFIFNVFIYKK